MLFQLADYDDHELVAWVRDPSSGLRAIVAIHDSTLGPAHGGTRAWHYEDDTSALVDALRLSQGMTYKNALADLPFGGGKSVILLRKGQRPTQPTLRAFGRVIERLSGQYILAEDVGIGPAEVEIIATTTQYACGLPDPDNHSTLADPSPFTAHGVFLGIKAALELVRETDDLTGITVAVQGLGGVGYYLCTELHDAGAKLLVSDLNTAALEKIVQEFGAKVVHLDRIHAAEADVFAPCALGAILNPASIPEIRAKIVCGGANNQLDTIAAGQLLEERGILYIPDFIANAGGVTHTSSQITGISRIEVNQMIERIPERVRKVLMLAQQNHITPQEAGEHLAKQIISEKS